MAKGKNSAPGARDQDSVETLSEYRGSLKPNEAESIVQVAALCMRRVRDIPRYRSRYPAMPDAALLREKCGPMGEGNTWLGITEEDAAWACAEALRRSADLDHKAIVEQRIA